MFTPNDEFLPSQWSQRFTGPAEVLQHHVATVRSGSAAARARLQYETLAYGPGEAEKIDLFGTELPAEAPICVFIHGGFWQAGSREDSSFVATHLCAAGYKVGILGYALCPEQSLSGLVEQIGRAAKFIGDYADRLGSKHITYVGHSAGAHLIACMLHHMQISAPEHLQLIRHAFLVSGVYDLRELSTNQAVNPHDALQLWADQTLVARLSPMLLEEWQLLAESQVTVHVVVAEHDSPAFRRQSQDFARLLQLNGVSNDFHRLEICDHFDIMENLTNDKFQLTIAIVNTV